MAAVNEPRFYMGEHLPVLACHIDDQRWVHPTAGDISDRCVTPRGALYWVVAVVDCPYCAGRHEHPMAAGVGWGFYRAGCSQLNDSQGYYLIVE